MARSPRTREEGYQEVRASAVTGEVSEGDSAGASESPRSSGDGDAGRNANYEGGMELVTTTPSK